MKTKSILSILFLFFAIIGMANETFGNLKGIIQDHTGNGLPYVTIEIYSKTDPQELISGGMTDEHGYFEIDQIPFGEYEMVLMAIGYADEVQDLAIQSTNQDLGTIQIGTEEIVQLQGAEIRADVSTFKTEIDKRVIEVGKDLVSAGADAASVLNTIPSVSVDQQTGEISLRGNENVKVFIDGKPSNIPAAQLLKQMPSNSIAKIEIITNPSSKYEAEGNSGIINIITHKLKRKGYNVGLNLGYTQGTYAKYMAALNTNLNVGNFNFFANYNANPGENYHFGYRTNESTNMHQTFGVMDDSFRQLMKFGFDWFISENTALTLYTNLGFNDGTGYIKSEVYGKAVPQRFYNYNDLNGYTRSADYSLNLKQNFGRDNHHLTLDAIYSLSNDTDRRNFTDSFPESYHNEYRESDYENTRINLDYVNELEKIGTIEAGIQYRKEGNANHFDSNLEVYEDGNTFNPRVEDDFQRDIYSAYINYEKTFGRFGLQAGLRAELVNESGWFNIVPTGNSNYENDYLGFYPSAFFTYEITDRGLLSFNYSRRIDRPGFNQISPMPLWSLTTLQNEGNPDLKPQYTNSFELGYLQKFKGGSINAVAFFRQINDRIFRYMEQSSTNENVTLMKWINYEKSNSYGFEVSANYKPANWWNFNLSFDWYANELGFDGKETTAKPYTIRTNNNFTIDENWSLQQFFMYKGKFNFIQGEMQPMWTLDLGARYSFMNGKASFTARVSDIFVTLKNEAKLYTPAKGISLTQWDSQTFYIGFTYNFGGDVRKRTLNQESEGGTPGGGLGL